jgi:hypothetical protein
MSKTVSSIGVYAMKNGHESKRMFASADYKGPTGARQAAMRCGSIFQADGHAVTVREFYEDGTSFDFVYPSA